MTIAERFERLPTAAKLLLILTAAILPIGLALVALGESGIRQANAALEGRQQDQAGLAARSIESLLARNALALRIAANGALAGGTDGACARAQRSLSITPGVMQQFDLERPDGSLLCTVGDPLTTVRMPIVAPGAIRLHVTSDNQAIAIRVGVIGGMATALVPLKDVQDAAAPEQSKIASLVVQDGPQQMQVVASDPGKDPVSITNVPIASGALVAKVGTRQIHITTVDRVLLLLPVLMWVAAALISWLLVSRLLIRPLKRLQYAVARYEPGTGPLQVKSKLGPSTEIQELRSAFERTFARVEESEREITGALAGQRRLVREVHHRVKNNLQVVASLLNIHGRSAATTEARGAYAAIGRRVGALSVVHRNHFAEMEENRGISLRPLLSELAAELRAGAPDSARGLRIDLELETVNSTQDVAVAVAFLLTEIVEFAMLNFPEDPIEVSLRRTSELTARLTFSSRVLNPEEAEQPDKIQFERIIGGLAKQLRSTLERKLGRYSVDLPVFPPIAERP